MIHPTYYRYLIYRSTSPFLLTTGKVEVVELLEELLNIWIPLVKSDKWFTLQSDVMFGHTAAMDQDD